MTFIDFLLHELGAAGFTRYVFCIGHLGDQMREHLVPPAGIDYQFSHERVPLGTGGALRNAAPLLQSDPVLVMNGDSFCPVSYPDLLADHMEHGSDATLVLTRVDDSSDYGTVEFASDGTLERFTEKSGRAEPGWVSSGIYVLSVRLMRRLPTSGAVSLERDLFPSLLGSRQARAYPHGSRLFDIGTPDRLDQFRQWVAGRALS